MMVYSFLKWVMKWVAKSNEMGILSVNLYNINLDNNFDEDDPDTIIHIRILTIHSKVEKSKALKKI